MNEGRHEASAMTLETRSSYPSQRSYVLQLHRDARPERGDVIGRLEHMVSGHHFEFRSGEQLLALLANEAAGLLPAPEPNADR
jgi:hypothetical protein